MRVPLLVLALASLNCGGLVRVTAGPTLDLEGEVSWGVAVSQGPVVPAGGQAVGVVGRLSGGYDEALDWSATMGPEWIAPKHRSFIGMQAGYRRSAGRAGVPVGLSAGVGAAVGRLGAASLLLGPELQCSYTLGVGAAPLSGGRCLLGLSIELLTLGRPASVFY